MNKKQLISAIRKEQYEAYKKQIASAIKAYDFLMTHKYKKRKDGEQLFVINGHECVCTYMDLRYGSLQFMPLDATTDIGTGAGGALHIDF